jgi:predicted nucleic acid-binding protein
VSPSSGPGLLVVDASVAAKWYVTEELSEEAVRLLEAGVRGEVSLIAPSLLLPELGNVLWHRHRRGDISRERVREAWAALEAAPLSFIEIGSLMPTALEVALACGCTAYDGLYVALAEARRGEDAALLTADHKLVTRLAGTPFAEVTRMLGEE